MNSHFTMMENREIEDKLGIAACRLAIAIAFKQDTLDALVVFGRDIRYGDASRGMPMEAEMEAARKLVFNTIQAEQEVRAMRKDYDEVVELMNQ